MTSPKRLRVAYLNPFPDLGGAEHSLLTLLDTLPESVSPLVVTSAEGELTRRLDHLDIPYEILATPSLRHWRSFRQSLRTLTSLLAEREIHLIHGNSPRGAFLGGLAARRLEIPSIWHLRVHLGRGPRPRILRHLNDRWLAVSQSLLREAGVTPKHKQVSVVANGVLPSVWRPQPRALPGLAQESRVPRIGMVGRVEPLKGIKEFVEMAFAFKKKGLPGEFIIAGGIVGPAAGRAMRKAEQYLRRLQQRVAEEGMQERIHFIGPVAPVQDFLDTLDVLVVPSHMEGFGRVVIEGMARGLPVVASKIGGIPEIIDTGRNGWLVPRRDPKALFLACRFLLRNPLMAQRMGEAGRRKVGEQFLSGHTTAGILKVYEELCGELPEISALPEEIPQSAQHQEEQQCT